MIRLILLLGLIVLINTFENNSHHPIKMIMNKYIDSSPAKVFKVWHFLHNRQYDINSEEGLQRYENFRKNLEIVKNHNLRLNNKYSIGLNNFADMTLHEFKTKYLNKNALIFKSVI
jgi:hypothetical protein